ncbi:hypothetical protein BCR37DRAFT_23498 [Protomyces lactucae-debilis]|uniref:AhpD-like protein n=1 Tax=Protomyces lactucae-debilis TaxID=2754530 RepID=A0A1Y2FGF2_PROLT|nr:uncharacterized protein BCR37DRAFT_23498 [Protomyces lactucae-debilis]ORY81905.1 hypothetical protein BCR37DRAFT_23498 [Protomyces lactucae-debilis]
MPSLSPELKSAIAKQSIQLPRGFNKQQSQSETFASIHAAKRRLQCHRAHDWPFILAACYTGFNFPQGIQCLWQSILQDPHIPASQHAHIGAAMREAVLKCIPFLGIPRVLLCLAPLQAAQGKVLQPDIEKILLPLRPTPKDTTSSQQMEAGSGLWDDIYAPKQLATKLRGKIATFHPNLANLIIQGSYGAALSPTLLIGRELTSAIAVAGLRCEEDVMMQLTSHVMGLLKGGGDEAYALAIMDVVDGLRQGTLIDKTRL